MSIFSAPAEPVWEPTGLKGGDVLALDAHAEHIIAVVGEAHAYRIYHSADGGRAWRSPWEDLPVDLLVTAVAAADDGVYVGLLKDGVLAARHGDASWGRRHAGLPHNAAITAVDAADGRIFAGTREHGLFVCEDGGAWQRLEDGEGGGQARESITSIVAAARGVIVVGMRHFSELRLDGTVRRRSARSGLSVPAVLAHAGHGRMVGWNSREVSYTDDFGATWVGLPDLPLEDACIRNVAVPNAHVFVGLHGRHPAGVLRYRGESGVWEAVGAGLPSPSWSALMCAVPGALLVGVGGGGIFRLPISEDTPVVGGPGWTMKTAANSADTVSAGFEITLGRPEEVRVEICGPDGTTVRSLRLGVLAAGSHDVSIDDAQIPAGLYTFTVTAGGLSRSVQRIILR